MTDEFHVIQLDEGCYAVHGGLHSGMHYASVGNPFIATRLGDLGRVQRNFLPEVRNVFKNAKIVKVKVNDYEICSEES